ncbi:MAG: ABC transporter substrate-binding protein, partial [Candidatus Thorarchaeota archaeon]|nr:ABC transporter substrate-binding protein [Candidatus Thorarchaeota archaeon]
IPNVPDVPDGPVAIVYNEAPMLKELVDNGTLPPVEDRLPSNPMLIEPQDEIGVYGGTWHMGLNGFSQTQTMRQYIGYENLLRWDPTWNRIIPNIAQSYDVNEDSTEFIFHLREGLKWSDGVNFTADDIVFCYEAEILNTNLSTSLNDALQVNGVPAIIEKIDNATVKFSFASPYGLFPLVLATLGSDELTNRPMHYLKQFHIDYNPDGIEDLVEEYQQDDWVELWNHVKNWNRNPDIPSIYAWTLTDWYYGSNVNLTHLILERNPYYWKIDTEYNQLPYIDFINYTIYSSSTEIRLAMLNGSIDMQHQGTNIASYYDDFVANMGVGGYELYHTLNTRDNAFTIQLNLVHEDPILRSVFSNKTFRIALSYGINRTDIIQQIYDEDIEPMQPAPRSGSLYYRDQLATQYIEYNVTLANELLDLAGYDDRDIDDFRLTPDGHRINFTISVTEGVTGNYYRVATMLSEYWLELGIIVNVEALNSWPMTQLIRANGHDALVIAGAEGYTAMLLSPGNFMPISEYNSYWAIPWVYWYANNSLGEEPPLHIKEQMQLYDQLKAASTSANRVTSW